jgi:Predicted nucleotidyltransferases
MRTKIYHTDWTRLLSNEGDISVEDFIAASPGVPRPTVNARIRALTLSGKLSRTGRGRYISSQKMEYKPELTPWMREISSFLIDSLPGVNHCLREKEGNLIVETDKCSIGEVMAMLRRNYKNVALKKDADRFSAPLNGYILVGNMISEAPITEIEGCLVDTLEKNLVDSICEQDDAGVSALQRAMEVHPVNMNRLKRYATRRNVGGRVKKYLDDVNEERIAMFTKVQSFLSGTDIIKAWVFGSYARGEETPSSDLDLLVCYDPSKHISLLTTIRYKLDLEKLIGKEVDLVEDGSLKPFAVPSANRDKYLIYER